MALGNATTGAIMSETTLETCGDNSCLVKDKLNNNETLPCSVNDTVMSTKPVTEELNLSNVKSNLIQRNRASVNSSDLVQENGSAVAAATKDSVNEATHKEFVPELRWPDLIVQTSLHVGCVYGFYLLFCAKFYTVLWFIFLVYASGFGITAGAHRLWSHKSYKAKWPLRLILIILFSIAGQRDAYTWAHDHRIHHKYSETDADPHNAKRGFFFAHIGWLFLTPHPDVVAKRKIIDMRDLESDPIVMWQKRLFIPIFALFVIIIPTVVPWYYWNESLWLSFWTSFCCRFVVVLNIAFFVNSAAHMWGNRPYDRNITPVENLSVAIAAMGEGWHNYHHVFPWDYKTGELGSYMYNFTTGFIDMFAKLGWAYDRKYVSPAMVARRAAKCGDGTHYLNDEHAHENPLWGYGDKDILPEDEEDLRSMTN